VYIECGDLECDHVEVNKYICRKKTW